MRPLRKTHTSSALHEVAIPSVLQAQRRSELRGKRTWSIIATRMILGLVLKHLNRERSVTSKGYKSTRAAANQVIWQDQATTKKHANSLYFRQLSVQLIGPGEPCESRD